MQFNHRYSSGIIKPQLLTIVVALLSHVYESLERSSFLAFFISSVFRKTWVQVIHKQIQIPSKERGWTKNMFKQIGLL